MKKVSVVVGLLAVSQTFIYEASAQQFTAGRLVVERVGTGAPQTSAATPIFLDEYTTLGVPGISIPMPTATVPPINQATESGVAASDGMVTRSVDGNYLIVPGYDAAVGTPAVASTPLNKVITRVDANGNMASTVVTDATAFSANNFRSVVSTDGSEYWLSGAGNGAVYVTHQNSTVPVAGTEVSNTYTDNRSLLIYNSQLYQSNATALNTGVYKVGAGLPSIPGNIMTVGAGVGALKDPYSFVILTNTGLPVMYMADFTNKIIYKFFQVGGVWNAAGSVTVTVGGVATGFYGITGNVAGGVVHLYATTTNGIGTNSRIVTFTDATTASTVIVGTAVGTTIVGPTSNTAFHGITFVPFNVSTITSALPVVCSGTGTTITITGNPNTVVTYQIAGITQPSVTLSGAGTYSFNTGPLTVPTTYAVVSATDGSITQTYAYSVTVGINALPAITTTPVAAICSGSSTVVNASGGISYTWAPATGLTSTVGTGITTTLTSTTTYTVTGTDGNGCSKTALLTVSVNPLPVISTGTAVSICNGGMTGLAASGGSVSYTWSPATGLSATTGAHVVATPTVTTAYTITGTDARGCVNTIVNTVTVNPVPAIFSSPDVTICAASPTVLSATGAVSYVWYPGTGLSMITGSSVTASPVATTVYTVNGTDANGCIGTATVTVSVNPLPLVSAGPNVDFCVGSFATLNATGALTYTWSPAIGLSSTAGSTVTANPASSTSYTLTGTDGNGCVNKAIIVVAPRLADPMVPGPSVGICYGSSTLLHVSGAAAFTWSPSTGLSSTSGSIVTASPTSTTTYTITETDFHGCMNTATVTVTVYPIPVVSAGPGVAICNGSSTTLTSTGGGTFTWSPGTGLSTTTGSTVTAHPTSTTTYTITCINVCLGTGTVTVTVNPLPAMTTTGATICMGSPAAISAGGASTYTWSPATGLSATTGNSVTANPTSNTIYTVTGTDANGCVRTLTATVNVNLLPTISTGFPPTICNGLSTTLTASGGVTYSWAPGTGLSTTVGSSVVASPTTTTIYTVTGTSPYGCTNKTTIGVNVNPLPNIYSVTGGGSFCAGGLGFPVGLSNSQGGIRYDLLRGSLPTGISTTGTGSPVDFGHPGITGFYTVVATNTATGCHDTMAGGAGITVNPHPAVLAVTGGGSYCTGGTGVHVGLIGSAAHINYQLYRDTIAIGSPVAGSGVPIDFGLQTASGTYTVVATDPLSTCASNMTGSATVNQNPLPAMFDVSGGGGYCVGDHGVHIGLVGSQIGARYGVYLGGVPVSGSLIGLATALDFGLFTTPGTYKVLATNSITGCADTMPNVVTVSVNPVPTTSGLARISHHDTTTISASPAGGTWTTQSAVIATVSPTGLVTGNSLGATTLTYTLPSGCYDTHYITIAFNVGVQGVNSISELSLAPNPNNGMFTLKGTFADPTEHDAMIEITNVVGQVVYSNKVLVQNGEMNEHISLGNSAGGVYILSVKTANGSKVIRFVKE